MSDTTNYLQLAAFDTVFNALLSLNLEARTRSPVLPAPFKSWQMYRDFFSISFDAAMRSGKSVWLAKKADKEKDCIITLCAGTKEILYDAEAVIYSMPNVKSLAVADIPQYRFVFVDMASWFSRKDIKRIYKKFGHKDVTFVFVG